MQGRGRFFIILGVVLLALAIVGGLLIVVLQSRGGLSLRPASPTPAGPEAEGTEEAPEMKEVVVALQNIGMGDKIRPDMVDIRPVAVGELEGLPEEPFTRVSDVKGKLATQDIYQGDPLVPAMVIAIEDVQRLGGPAAFLVPSGRVAVAFPVSQLSSVNYALQPGDKVDVIACGAFIDVDVDTQIKTPLFYTGGEDCQPGCQVMGDQVQRTFCQLTVDDAEVLGIGTWGPPPPPPPEEGAEGAAAEGTAAEAELPTLFDSVILVVKPQDAVVLMYFLKNDYLIDLVLRSGQGEESHETEQVTLEYIMTRFGISSPTKLPYRLEAMKPPESYFVAPPTPVAPPE